MDVNSGEECFYSLLFASTCSKRLRYRIYETGSSISESRSIERDVSNRIATAFYSMVSKHVDKMLQNENKYQYLDGYY